MAQIRTFRDLIAWQKAHQLVWAVYKLSRGFPDDEKFGLTSQMRRAVVSVAANIAEGFVRNGQQNKLHFFNIAQGSLEEVKYYLILAKDLGYTENVTKEGALAGEGRTPSACPDEIHTSNMNSLGYLATWLLDFSLA